MIRPFTLHDFLAESNKIERIEGVTGALEFAAKAFLDLSIVTIADLAAFVDIAQPGAILRDKATLNVRVGNYIAEPGGAGVVSTLQELLEESNTGLTDPYEIHIRYEMLHPFTDGNGRSGRILWLWAMGGLEQAPLGFLHHFYYQTLEHGGEIP